MSLTAARRVPETRFGIWFQGTGLWKRYVLGTAVEEMVSLLGSASGRFPRVLDAGCGSGLAFPLLREHLGAEQIVGVDIDSGLVEQGLHAEEPGGGSAQIRIGDARALPLPDASFDLVFCHQLLHHAGDQERVVREFHRLLVPGGTLLLAESCRRFIHTPAVRLLFRHPMDVQRSPAGYLDLLRKAGFEFGADQVSQTSPFWSRPDFGLLERLGWRAPAEAAEATQIVVAARRVP